MTSTPPSIEIWQDKDGWLHSELGTISPSNVWRSDPGRMHDMGDLILVTVPFARDTRNLAELGIAFTVTDGVAHTVATNGTWHHHLQPAHWRGGIVPHGWSETIMLGRAQP